MKKQYHILNGDSLKNRFPAAITGEVIVARECLVDGNVEGNTLQELFQTRAEFIASYGGYSKQDYFDKTVPEIQKIENIVANSEVNLWFEDDLFCQVNLWFTLHLLCNLKKKLSLYLIRPKIHKQYGFAGLNTLDLQTIYKDRNQLASLNKLTLLWNFYQKADVDNLFKIALELKDQFPFVFNAVNAHIERIPTDERLGRPSETLIQIMKDLKSDEFGKVFREFCKREPIYGFGDLQVKRLLDCIKENHL